MNEDELKKSIDKIRHALQLIKSHEVDVRNIAIEEMEEAFEILCDIYSEC
ncbi:MAG: hypothetical protein KDC67_11980 [Ignavibacteriae bacterium]|nr:hypothetical protein [Ignavibacteriota bacterium]